MIPAGIIYQKPPRGCVTAFLVASELGNLVRSIHRNTPDAVPLQSR